MFETAINEGYDIILINAGGSSGLDSCFEQAEEAGILVVPVDNLYPWAGSIGVQTDQTTWAGNSCKALCEGIGGKVISSCFTARWARLAPVSEEMSGKNVLQIIRY